jgi:FMN reductase
LSSTEQAMRLAAAAAEAAGAEVTIFGGDYLRALPHYRGEGYGIEDGAELVEAVRRADGVIISAPGYHGSISGLVKNALDYLGT